MSIRNSTLIEDDWSFTVWEDAAYTPLVVENPVEGEPFESAHEIIASRESSA